MVPYNHIRKSLIMRKTLFLGFCVLLTAAGVAYAAGTGYLAPVGNGTYQDLTPVGSASRFENVDDSPACNGLTDYNETFVVGDRDSYFIDISSIPNGSLVTQIDIVPCASRASVLPGGAKMKVFAIVDSAQSADKGNYSIGLGAGNTPIRLATTTIFTNFIKTATTTVQIGAVLSDTAGGLRLGGIRGRLVY
jgi:hypothetical protein